MSGSTLYKKGGVDNIRRVFPDPALAEVERAFWDSVAQEPARLSGTPIRFWSLRRAANRHPLYKEPSGKSVGDGEWEYQGPFELMAAVEFDQGNQTTAQAGDQGGIEKSADATAWIARKEVEDREAPAPKEGDVVEFWDGFGGSALAGQKHHFDVVVANRDGNIVTSDVFVMYKLTLKTRTRFDPGRKVGATEDPVGT